MYGAITVYICGMYELCARLHLRVNMLLHFFNLTLLLLQWGEQAPF